MNRRAFTLLELLVVVAIIVLGTVLLIPAFGSIITSAKYTGAVNTVTATLGQARALAIRNGRETGVVFLFDADREAFTMQVVELLQTGGALTQRATVPGEHTYANVYRPALNTVPIELPSGTGVYGLSFDTAPPTDESGGLIDSTTNHWYAGEVYINSDNNEVIPWIFPRNDPRMYVEMPKGQSAWAEGPNATSAYFLSNQNVRRAIRQSNTFFIQFSREGSIVDTVQQGGVASVNSYLEYPSEPRDLDTDEAEPFDKPSIFDPDARPRNNARQSDNPEVVLRPVARIAVVDFTKMTQVVGIEKPWLVRPAESSEPRLAVPSQGQTRQRYYNDRNTSIISSFIDNNAEIISFNRYSGNAIREAHP